MGAANQIEYVIQDLDIQSLEQLFNALYSEAATIAENVRCEDPQEQLKDSILFLKRMSLRYASTINSVQDYSTEGIKTRGLDLLVEDMTCRANALCEWHKFHLLGYPLEDTSALDIEAYQFYQVYSERDYALLQLFRQVWERSALIQSMFPTAIHAWWWASYLGFIREIGDLISGHKLTKKKLLQKKRLELKIRFQDKAPSDLLKISELIRQKDW
ncbi:MAG: hypothetical protein AB4040_10725 [Synechococcus sp.]